MADSDGDGYQDGSEVINGYDPVVAGSTLEQTGRARRYNHPLYSLLYPSSWELRDQSPGSVEVLFMSGSGEFIEVLIIQNLSNQTLDQWFDQQFPQLAQTELDRVSFVGINGIIHPDGLSYYLVSSANPASIYLVTYNTAGISGARYTSTLRFMVNSFRLTQ
jgi:hypothetical protein